MLFMGFWCQLPLDLCYYQDVAGDSITSEYNGGVPQSISNDTGLTHLREAGPTALYGEKITL